MEADEKRPKVDLAKTLVQSSSSHLWPPEIESAEQREDDGAEEHLVEVSDHESGIGHLEIEWRASQDNSGQSSK